MEKKLYKNEKDKTMSRTRRRNKSQQQHTKDNDKNITIAKRILRNPNSNGKNEKNENMERPTITILKPPSSSSVTIGLSNKQQTTTTAAVSSSSSSPLILPSYPPSTSMSSNPVSLLTARQNTSSISSSTTPSIPTPINTKEGKQYSSPPTRILTGRKQTPKSTFSLSSLSNLSLSYTEPVKFELFDSSLRFIGTKQLVETIQDFNDFTVIGCIGYENVGKSTLLSALCDQDLIYGRKLETEENIYFPVKTIESMMQGFPQTKGIHGYIVANKRMIFLDCQPLMCDSVFHDLINSRDVQYYSSLPYEAQVEIVSICQVILLYSICHAVIVVQDRLVDPELWQFLKIATELKTKMPDVLGETTSSKLHIAESIFVANKINQAEFGKENELAFRYLLHVAFQNSKVNPFIPRENDMSQGLKNGAFVIGFEDRMLSIDVHYEETLLNFHRTIWSYSLQPFSRKGRLMTFYEWLSSVGSLFDCIKKSPAIAEYARKYYKRGK